MKMIFQDPISSLNPRRKVEDIIAEGLRIWKIGTDEEQQQKVDEAMLAVGLDPALQRGRRPHQFSGGQCQRISIARAVVTDPKLIICDEPVSALDVSVQAQILNLLEDMKTALRAHADLHRARPRGREERERPRRRDVPRQDLRGRARPTCSTSSPRTRTPPALLASIPVPDPSVKPEERPRARGRDPVAGRAAERLPVPHPVPEGAGRVRGRGAADPRGRARAVRRVPLPAGARRDAADRNGQTPPVRRSRQLARGRPSMRWARMFLFTCVVPPAIVSARL